MSSFKRATLSDLATLLEILPLYYASDGLDYEPKKAERGLRLLITEPGFGEIWLIRDDADAIGYLALAFGFTLEFGGREAFVDELFLKEEFRGKGLGKRAIEHAIDRCEANQIHALRLEVTRGNSRALKFYKSLGFEDLGRHLLTREI